MGSGSAENSENVEKGDQKVDVLILGGGLAGLGAAIQIKNSKFNGDRKCSYLILEAQNTAGGRVKSERLVEFQREQHHIIRENESAIKFETRSDVVDSGAQWLHGRSNFLYLISEKHGLLAPDQSEEGLGSFFYENREQIDPFFVKKIDFHIGKLLQECESFVHCTKLKTINTYPESVGHFLRERFHEFTDSLESPQDMKRAKDLFDWHMRFQIVDNSCISLDQLSAKYWGKYSFNGESGQAHYNFKNCFHSVVDHLISELDCDSIHFSKEVTKVTIHDVQTKLKTRANLTVKCSDGNIYRADIVLITFSMGILKKKHETMFRPSLPSPLRKAIESIGFGTINKIFLEFDTPWWHELDGIQLVYPHRDKKISWTHYLTGFDILRNNKNVLLGWVGGIGAIQMEALSDNQIIVDCVNLLSKFTNMNVPYPIRYYCTRWYSNPYVHGAYSYISSDCDNNETISDHILNRVLTYDAFHSDIGAQHIEIPSNMNAKFIKNPPVILFAGEACHEKYFSTAHGAFLSGMEQAQKIVDFFR